MCDLICEVMTPHVALRGSLKDVVIEHIKHYGQKCQALFDYPLFDNCLTIVLFCRYWNCYIQG
jgi:hypothetical protein